MTLKKHLLSVFILYTFIYLYAPLSNPLIPLNIAEGIFLAFLFIGSFIISYILFFTKLTNFSQRVKNNIVAFGVLFIAFIVYYKPLSFSNIYNIYLSNLQVVSIFIIVLLVFIWWIKLNRTTYATLLLLLPAVIQGVLMRVDNKFLIFYIKNPNVSIYILIIFLIFYYFIFNRRK